VTAAPRRQPRIRGASEQVASEIQHYISRKGLGPGDFLGREEDLAAEFGVSRPTLREALKMLASGNLIRASKGPGGGIFVALTADQGMSRSLSDAIAMMLETGAVSLNELLEARLVLEVPLAGQAAYRADAETVERLREALAAGDEAALHRIVAATAGNRMVQAFTDWVFEVLQPALMEIIGKAVVHTAVVEQHEALVNAIEKGDAPRAERAMKEHLLYLGDVLRMVET
jgi:GntR family transcriptional regulator, transcriptional repressor for pyruvate dehydrogenase complex